ncbi:GNAT family N-acetyltransferase [Bacteroidota bacterium]
MFITSANITLRFSQSDDPELKELIQDVEELYPMSEARLYPAKMPKEMMFRIEINGKLIGEAGYKTIKWYNRKAEISIIIAKEHRGKGYGKEVINALLKYGFEKMNLYRIEAEVIAFNEVSVKMIEGLGFVKEGTLREAKYSNGKYWDIYRYGILRSEYDKLKM